MDVGTTPAALLIFLPFLAIGLLSSLFWIWMLIDCLTKEPAEGNDKLIWALVIFFGNLLGAVLYFFVRRPQRIAQQDYSTNSKSGDGKKPLAGKPSHSGQSGCVLVVIVLAMLAIGAAVLLIAFVFLFRNTHVQQQKSFRDAQQVMRKFERELQPFGQDEEPRSIDLSESVDSLINDQ